MEGLYKGNLSLHPDWHNIPTSTNTHDTDPAKPYPGSSESTGLNFFTQTRDLARRPIENRGSRGREVHLIGDGAANLFNVNGHPNIHIFSEPYLWNVGRVFDAGRRQFWAGQVNPKTVRNCPYGGCW